MVKIINPFRGQDPVASAFSRVGGSYQDIAIQKLHAAQAYEAERKNAELANLAAQVSGGNFNDTAAAEALLAGLSPADYGGYGRVHAATTYGAQDPRTGNWQVAAGDPYSSTFGAFDANQQREAEQAKATLAEQAREHDAALAQQAADNAQQSMDRRYGVDQTQAGEMTRFNLEPKPAMVLGTPAMSAGPGGMAIPGPAPMVPGFAPQGDLVSSGAQPIQSLTDVQGTRAQQLIAQPGGLGAANPADQAFVSAQPTQHGDGTPKQWLATDGRKFTTTDGVHNAADGSPLPMKPDGSMDGNFVSVTGSSTDTGITNPVKAALEQSKFTLERFGHLLNQYGTLVNSASDVDFGAPGVISTYAQDLANMAKSMSSSFGITAPENLVNAIANGQSIGGYQNNLTPQMRQNLFTFDPKLGQLALTYSILVYTAAAALYGQQNRSVSDQDVQNVMAALGDPHSWVTSKQTVVSKIAYLRQLGAAQYQDVTRQLAGQPVAGGDPFAASGAPAPAPASAPPTAGEITVKRGPDGRLIRTQ